MTTDPTITASLAAACAAHDRHRLDVLDALLDEVAPSAVRELLGAALDMCATLRAERDELRAVCDELYVDADRANGARDAACAAARAHLAADDALTLARRTDAADVPTAEARADAARECLAGLVGYVGEVAL